jgi:hypothetical protein
LERSSHLVAIWVLLVYFSVLFYSFHLENGRTDMIFIGVTSFVTSLSPSVNALGVCELNGGIIMEHRNSAS